MKEHPILFRDRLVRAILAGRKTQTRRLAKNFDPDVALSACPYGAPGDLLWVREAWSQPDPAAPVAFRADERRDAASRKWKPSIHLRRADARLFLEVVSVRVERLQSISEEDAVAEGVESWGNGWLGPVRHLKAPRGMKGAAKVAGFQPRTGQILYATAREAFIHLWDSINATRPGASWAENPWIWAIEFKQLIGRSYE